MTAMSPAPACLACCVTVESARGLPRRQDCPAALMQSSHSTSKRQVPLACRVRRPGARQGHGRQ